MLVIEQLESSFEVREARFEVRERTVKRKRLSLRWFTV